MEKYPYTNYHNLNLDWVIGKIKEFEERMNGIEGDILAKANSYVDEQLQLAVKTLQEDYTSFVADVENKIEGLDKSYEGFVADVTNRMVLMTARIERLQENVDSVLAQANAYTQQAIANNNEYVVEQTTKALGTVTVLNYFTGARTSIQEMFDYLAQFHLQNAISYSKMNTRALTYEQFNNVNMTYTDLALDGASLYN